MSQGVIAAPDLPHLYRMSSYIFGKYIIVDAPVPTHV